MAFRLHHMLASARTQTRRRHARRRARLNRRRMLLEPLSSRNLLASDVCLSDPINEEAMMPMGDVSTDQSAAVAVQARQT